MISGFRKTFDLVKNFFSKKDTYIFSRQLFKEPSLLKMLEAGLKKFKTVLVLYFDIVKFHEVEQVSGPQAVQRVLTMFEAALKNKIPELLRNEEILAVKNLWGDDFIVLLASTQELGPDTLQDIAIASRIRIRESLKCEMVKITGRSLEIHVGYAVLNASCENLESRLYNAVREAQGIAKGTIDLQTARFLHEFRGLLDNMCFDTVYQPIVSFRSGSILGWEALARGHRDSYFHSPDIIFNFAEEAGLLYPLERVCRQIAINRLGELGSEQKIFLNIHPRTISDPNFVRGETLKLIRKVGLKPCNIVFEITEKHNINDFSHFNKTLEYYRSQGFLVAVDDVGSGFSCLQSIAEIRPDFIKIDMSLIRDIHINPVKRALLETFVTFAEKIGCSIIAEGIEEEDELNVVAHMGVHYGQGYLIGKPVYPKPFLSDEISVKVMRLTSNERNRIWKKVFPVGDIIENAVSVGMDQPVWEVKKIFEDNELLSGVVVLENAIPRGLVMRHHLYRYLSMQYGVPLYYERSIASLMDPVPLVVEGNTPIETVSQVAMNRTKTKLYDYIIVTNNQLIKGVVSVQTLLDTMTRIRLEMAKGANPLTGLPGNIAIEQELMRRTCESRTFSVIYMDLDYFKSYNDRYGFESGDRVILFTSRLLNAVLQKYGGGKCFLGHIGGDDFIAVTEKEYTDALCKRIIRYFDRLVKSFYLPEDRREGRISGLDREGQEKYFPLISISMAVIECREGEMMDLKTLSETAAQLKRFAKSIPGSVYVYDRRYR